MDVIYEGKIYKLFRTLPETKAIINRLKAFFIHPFLVFLAFFSTCHIK